MGGAMDLASCPNTKVIVLMEHGGEDGNFRILEKCNLPLTGAGVVETIITDIVIF